MLHEDFNKACRLLHKMTAHPDLQPTHVSPHLFKYVQWIISSNILSNDSRS